MKAEHVRKLLNIESKLIMAKGEIDFLVRVRKNNEMSEQAQMEDLEQLQTNLTSLLEDFKETELVLFGIVDEED